MVQKNWGNSSLSSILYLLLGGISDCKRNVCTYLRTSIENWIRPLTFTISSFWAYRESNVATTTCTCNNYIAISTVVRHKLHQSNQHVVAVRGLMNRNLWSSRTKRCRRRRRKKKILSQFINQEEARQITSARRRKRIIIPPRPTTTKRSEEKGKSEKWIASSFVTIEWCFSSSSSPKCSRLSLSARVKERDCFLYYYYSLSLSLTFNYLLFSQEVDLFWIARESVWTRLGKTDQGCENAFSKIGEGSKEGGRGEQAPMNGKSPHYRRYVVAE